MSNAWRTTRSLRFLTSLILAIASCYSPVFARDTLQEIKQRGVLRWGADAEGGAPYVYPDPEKPGRLIGFEVEIAEALAQRLGLKAEMIQNQWDQLIPALD